MVSPSLFQRNEAKKLSALWLKAFLRLLTKTTGAVILRRWPVWRRRYMVLAHTPTRFVWQTTLPALLPCFLYFAGMLCLCFLAISTTRARIIFRVL